MDAGTFTQKKGSMMAEEEFDVNDMPVTDRYRIPYPGEDNLTRFAGQQFEAMATAVDKQLGEVDDRQTDAARSTIVRNTLAELQAVESKATGQFGYVTDDPDPEQIGIWCWNGDSWSKVSGATPMTVVKNTLAELHAVTGLSDGVMGLVTSDPIATNNGAYIRSNDVWSPITGASGGTLTADTLAQLEGVTASTGTLAYVSADPVASNNLVYVRTTAAAWEPVGGAQTQIIDSGFTCKINNQNPKVADAWGTVNGRIATLHGVLYDDDYSWQSPSTRIAAISVPQAMRPSQKTNVWIPIQILGSTASSTASADDPVRTFYMPATVGTDGTINLGTFQQLEDRAGGLLAFSSASTIQVILDGASWLLD